MGALCPLVGSPIHGRCGGTHLSVSTKGAPSVSRPLFHRASLGSRLAAHLVDRFLFFLSLIFAGALAGATESTSSSWLGIIVAGIIVIGYVAWFCHAAARGTTPGKRLIGLKLLTSEGHTVGFWIVVVRETLGKLISSIFGIGFIWAFFNYYDRALHDIIFDTHVVEAAKYSTATVSYSEKGDSEGKTD